MTPKRPQVHFIVAMDSARGIGKDNTLPWHLPEDLKRFKRLTMGQPMLMGRKTAQSLGRTLPGRLNLVLSRSGTVPYDGMVAVTDIESALRACGDSDVLWVIGGADVFRQMLSLADALYLTLIQGEFGADTFFPPIDSPDWREIEREDHPQFSFVTLVRNKA